MRRPFIMVASLAGLLASALVGERTASACGGCFHDPTENPSVVTDHRMILSISAKQTTLYDQVRYSGNPASFAWVLPISGEAKVGLSSDVVFASLDGVTATTISAPPPPVCPVPDYSCGEHGAAGAADAGSLGAGGDPVTVTHQETVGPYETVQLHSSDPNALNSWLTSHGYAIPADVQPIIAAYVNEHFDFLALKLVPGQGVNAMRPVRVTTAGASPVLPLRMVAAGTGATVGITLWVLAEGRYETQNFPSFTIGADELTWDYSTQSSNYTTLRKSKEAALNGRGWQIESSLGESASTLTSRITRSGVLYGPVTDGSADYPPIPATDAGAGETSSQVRDDDLATLFAGLPESLRVTRLRSDLAHDALANDLVLTASADQSELPNALRVTQTVNAPVCPAYGDPPPCNDPGNGVDGTGTGGGTVRPGSDTFSCSASPLEPLSPEAIGGVIAIAGLVAARSRNRKARCAK